MKKADLSLNYIFIIFISVIAVFVIVGMLTGWAFSAKNMMCKLSGDCTEEQLLDKQTISVDGSSGNTRFVTEIVKHAKICYERSRKSENRGELCYTVTCSGCTADCTGDNIAPQIESSIGKDKADCSGFVGSNKAIIEFDYSSQRVLVR